MANRPYMPKMSIRFVGFVVWNITGKRLHIFMTQVLQILQTKPCRTYKNVDYAGIWIWFFYRDFPVNITYLLQISVYDYYVYLHHSSCSFFPIDKWDFSKAFLKHELPVIFKDTISMIFWGNTMLHVTPTILKSLYNKIPVNRL